MVFACGELAHRGGEVLGGDVLVQLLERGDAVGDELVEHAAGPGARLVGAERLDALAVVAQARRMVGALDQAAAEHALQLGEAVVAERLREAHQAEGCTPGAARERGHGVERHVLRVLEREGGDALQLRRQPGIEPGQACP